VKRDIVPDPDDEALTTVIDDKIGVGNTTPQRLGFYG
jgi:hypothetical protein